MALGQPTGAGTRTDAYPWAGSGFYLPSGGTILVNQLGYWDEGGDGLAIEHQIGLFQYNGAGSSYTMIATATIPSGTAATLDGGYRWVEIPAISIPDIGQGGNYYVIMASHGTDAWTNGLGSGAPMDPGFGTLSSGALDFGGGTTVGSSGDINSSGGTFFGGANLGYAVPEPSAMAIAAIGILASVALRRRVG